MTPGKTPPSTGRKVVLTKDELRFCEDQGIKPEEFAKQRLDLEARKKGVYA
jgi:hypothetical protein